MPGFWTAKYEVEVTYNGSQKDFNGIFKKRATVQGMVVKEVNPPVFTKVKRKPAPEVATTQDTKTIVRTILKLAKFKVVNHDTIYQIIVAKNDAIQAGNPIPPTPRICALGVQSRRHQVIIRLPFTNCWITFQRRHDTEIIITTSEGGPAISFRLADPESFPKMAKVLDDKFQSKVAAARTVKLTKEEIHSLIGTYRAAGMVNLIKLCEEPSRGMHCWRDVQHTKMDDPELAKHSWQLDKQALALLLVEMENAPHQSSQVE